MANSKATMKIMPIADRVLVQREETPAKKSASGIIIPDTAEKEKSKIGVILAVGPGRVSDEGRLIAMSIKPGSRVIFNAGWDNEVKMEDSTEGQEYFLVQEKDILAVIK